MTLHYTHYNTIKKRVCTLTHKNICSTAHTHTHTQTHTHTHLHPIKEYISHTHKHTHQQQQTIPAQQLCTRNSNSRVKYTSKKLAWHRQTNCKLQLVWNLSVHFQFPRGVTNRPSATCIWTQKRHLLLNQSLKFSRLFFI